MSGRIAAASWRRPVLVSLAVVAVVLIAVVIQGQIDDARARQYVDDIVGCVVEAGNGSHVGDVPSPGYDCIDSSSGVSR